MSVETVFAAAAQKPITERLAYLDEACGADAELRRKVDRLLVAHDAAGDFLESPAQRPNGTIDEPPITERPGSMIGPYKLKEQIGEGGFGLVFVAEQQEPVKRKVALKVIKPGMDTREVMARFTAERQALALMDHPNIARVLDAGATDSGRPYFVMELVRGIPITEYCDQNLLSPRDRLDLFITVCQAVQHAHQKGIIHRDIKPSNVLVTSHDGKPVAKVIDFGVAKAINQQLTERSIYTNFTQMIGTPLYMSPEQAEMSGLDIDTRSDIYSLGVLLYELLTGSTPFEKKRFAKAAYDEIRRIIREDEPQKPSTRLSTSDSIASIAAQRHTEPAKLSKLMRGDLDWITMKALEKDRTRRYETANGLARDIQRYLSDEPVEACPPSATYRLRKFAKKNRATLATAGLFAFTLVLFSALCIWFTMDSINAQHRAAVAQGLAEQERDRANAEATKAKLAAVSEAKARLDALEKEKLAVEQRTRAEKARDRTRDVLDAMTSEITGDSLTTQKAISPEQKKFLSEVLMYYREFAGEKADDEKTRARTAEAAYRVGLIEGQLGRKEQGIAAYQMARDGYQKLAADFPAVPGYQRKLARSHNNLGLLLAGLGKGAEAEEQHRQAQTIQEKLAADFPTVPGHRQDLARSHGNRGNLLAGLGRRGEAEEQYCQALAIQERLAADFPTVSGYRQELARSHGNRGNLLAGLGRRVEAEEQYRQALAIQEKLAADFPAVSGYRWELAHSHNSLGLVLAELGKRAEAEEQYRQALAIQEKLAADFPAVPGHRQELARSHGNRGNLLGGLGRRAEAEEQYRQTLAIQEKLAADFPAVSGYQIELGGSYCNYGNLVRDAGRAIESPGWFDKAIATLATVHRAEPRDVTAKQFFRNSHWGRAMAYDRLMKRTEALQDWDRAIELSPPAEQLGFRASRANSRLRAGMVAEAVAEVAELTKSTNWNADQWYSFACIYAVASGKIADKKREYADRAMELLTLARAAGYKDAAHMKKDTDLDPLREREDFKKLIAELEKGAAAEKQVENKKPAEEKKP
jgi:serine/threonine protein kinase/tetratricopeptide (TPR) repeat protein